MQYKKKKKKTLDLLFKKTIRQPWKRPQKKTQNPISSSSPLISPPVATTHPATIQARQPIFILFPHWYLKIEEKNKSKKPSPFLIVENHPPLSSTGDDPSFSSQLLHCQPTSTMPATTSLPSVTVVQTITVVIILITDNKTTPTQPLRQVFP